MAKTFELEQLLSELTGEVSEVVNCISNAAQLSNEALNVQPLPGKWSVAQVVEHLNTYNRYYIPLMQKALRTSRTGNGMFKSGWLGEYFTKSMYSEVKTSNRVANKMSAMKGHIPGDKMNGHAVLNEFLSAQNELLQLLEAMRGKDLAGVKIPITISRFIKIRLGDAARFLVAHQVRHLLQVKNTLKAISAEKQIFEFA
jgi:hypothetical protein